MKLTVINAELDACCSQVIVKKLSSGARLVLKSNYNYEILKARHAFTNDSETP